MPRPGHGAGQRGGHGRRPQRAGQLPRVQATAEAVDDAHHRLRRPPDPRPRRPRLARGHQAAAAQLDRPVRGGARALPHRRSRDGSAGPAIEVFTTRPDTLFGATYMVLAPEHPLVDQLTAADWPDDIADAAARRRGPAGTPRRPTPSPPTAARPTPAPTSSARSRTARRPACSSGRTRPTPRPAPRSRCSSPTTC